MIYSHDIDSYHLERRMALAFGRFIHFNSQRTVVIHSYPYMFSMLHW